MLGVFDAVEEAPLQGVVDVDIMFVFSAVKHFSQVDVQYLV
jgi:hypothetical protein